MAGVSETVTFVFTDLVASTQLWERHPDAMPSALERHDAILHAAVAETGGRVVKTTGDGVMAVFTAPTEAVRACLDAQQALEGGAWGDTGPLRVRMGIHTGEARVRGDDFFGPPVNRTARIMAVAHGGQVLLSARAAEAAGDALPPDAGLRDLGEHRLRDLSQAERLYQLTHPSLPSDFPPLATLDRRPNNLPVQISEFFGRQPQLAMLRDVLESEAARLVTLTGPGGIGKTRLALQAAADRIDQFPDGVFFVDLSVVAEAGGVFQAIVRTLGIAGSSDKPPLELLKEQLAGRRTLLVLDNFEQVIDAADAVADLLEHCPQLTTLVTSREALRVRGERLVAVPSLDLPPAGRGQATPETVAASEAGRLFVERAQAAVPQFALTAENAEAVAEICRRLDGLPLAIELAAARLKLFTPEELRDRLGSRLNLLRGGARDLPDRQQTLRSTIEWSYQLLNPAERALVRLLAVFVTASPASVEDVAGQLEALRDVDVVDGLTSLLDKSLVRGVKGDGHTRLVMLETIREYAGEQLDADPDLAAAARRAHAEHFTQLALSRRERLHTTDRDDTLAELEAELGNLLAAWRFWVDAGDRERLNQLLDALWILHDARGWYHVAIRLAHDLLDLIAAAPPSPQRLRDEIALRVTLGRGLLAVRGYTEDVEAEFTRALALAEEAGALPQRASVLRSLASFHLYRGELDKGAALGQELLRLGQAEQDAGLQVEGELLVGSIMSFTSDVAAGVAHLDRAIALFDPDTHGSRSLRFGASPGVVAHAISALLLWLLGELSRAQERAAAALELARRIDHPFTLAYTIFHVGFLDLWREDWEQCRAEAVEVLAVAEQYDYPIWQALGMVLQGAAEAVLGRPEEGLRLTERGAGLYEGLSSPPVFWPLLLYMRATACGLAGRPADGLALIEEAVGTEGQDQFLSPSFELLRGDLWLARSERDRAAAAFQSAFDIADAFRLRTPQLRAAVRLARLRADDPAGADEALTVLRGVHETFAGEPDNPDLAAARELLDASVGLDAPGA